MVDRKKKMTTTVTVRVLVLLTRPHVIWHQLTDSPTKFWLSQIFALVASAVKEQTVRRKNLSTTWRTIFIMIIHQNYLVKKKVRILRSVGTQSEWVSIIMSYLLVKYLLVTLRWCLYVTCQYQRMIIQRMQLWSMHCDEFWRSDSYDVTAFFLQRIMAVPLENILLKNIQFFRNNRIMSLRSSLSAADFQVAVTFTSTFRFCWNISQVATMIVRTHHYNF